MSENQTGRRRKGLAAFLVIIVSGAMIASAFLILTYPRPETETLLVLEIDLPVWGFPVHEIDFNLTIPSAVSYIQVIINMTSFDYFACTLYNSTETEIWSEFFVESFSPLNYSSPWIEVYPGEFKIDIRCDMGLGNITVVGKSSLLTFEQQLAINLVGPIIGITAVVCVIVILILEVKERISPHSLP